MTRNCDEFLSLEELIAAEVFKIKSSQQRSFASEIKIIKAGIPLQVNYSLLTLHPVLIGGLLRVGGRLANSQLSAFQNSDFTWKRCSHSCHCYIQTSRVTSCRAYTYDGQSYSKYHVIGAKRLTRTICKQCVVCRKLLQGLVNSQWVNCLHLVSHIESVFSNVGIDYAGPVITKRGHTRRPILQKTYICVLFAWLSKLFIWRQYLT